MKNGPLWTIDELGAAVTTALAEGYEGPPNGRVRDLPDRRTIRYYTTLGLLDRAAEMRGRTALYGRRHLLQVVAIKKLQARGLSLAEVQHALLGQSDAVLEEHAGLKPGNPDVPAKSEKEPEAEMDVKAAQMDRAAHFWRDLPPPPPSSELAVAPELIQGVRLAEGVTLLLAAPSRPLDEADLRAIRTAAAPILALLARRQLIQDRNEKETP